MFTDFSLVVLYVKFVLIKEENVSYPTLAKGAGRKGEQKRTERVYSHNRTNEPPIKSSFIEIWVNKHPLMICSVSQVPLNKK